MTRALRTAENERLRAAFEDLERMIETESVGALSSEAQAMERGYRAALWVMREAIDDRALKG